MTLAPPAPRPALDPDAVMGDGTTLAIRSRTRWQRLRWPIVVAVVFLVAVGLSSLLQARTSTTPFAPNNPSAHGARAIAEILRDQGVEIHYVRSAESAVALAAEGTTLLVTPNTWALDPGDLARLADVPADIVLVESGTWAVSELSGGAIDYTWDTGAGSTSPKCDDPDARAAGQISRASGSLVATSDDVVICFPSSTTGLYPSGTYAVLDEGGRRVTIVADPALMTNAELDQAGNAALMLRALGRHDTLVWLVPDPMATVEAPGFGDLFMIGALPDWMPVLLLQLGVLLLVLAVWRGRRLGRIVTEPLPVVVRASEAAVGRGRLYHRAQSFGHAAAALRAGTAGRTAGRLGLPRTADAPQVIDAVARATGRPIEQVAGLLYGPPPTDDAGLVQLARLLDQLESEVHRT